MTEKKRPTGKTAAEPVKVGYVSLGCPKNQVDLEHMLAMLSEEGFAVTAEEIEADVIIVNTCAFIESAKQESIEAILDLAWLKKNRGLKAIVVTGCLAERYREEILREMPEVDAVVGLGANAEIAAAVRRALKGREVSAFGAKNACPLEGERLLTTPPYTAYLKIAEGCDNRCSYCVIPQIRGSFRSRPMEALVEEAKRLEASGVKELCLVAQDTSRYGLDLYGEYRLAALCRELLENTSIPWIRLLYCYPDKITPELLALLREQALRREPRLLPYLDLPIQHIDEEILRRMNRHGGSLAIREALRNLREQVPGIVIRSTAIVGFPGETEEKFEALCEFLKEAKFEHFGAFPYSREEGTPAAEMPGQIEEQVKQDRADLLLSQQQTVREEWTAAKLGKLMKVLYEGYDPAGEICFGRSAADAPEIDGKVYFHCPPALRQKLRPGDFLEIQITGVLDYDLLGSCRQEPAACEKEA